MLKIDRICIWIFIISFLFMLPSVKHLKFIDELVSCLFLAVALTDTIINRASRKYALLWIIIGVISSYAIYSLCILNYNSPEAIISDWIIQLKPFIPFAVIFAIRPQLLAIDRYILKIIALINFLILVIIFLCGEKAIYTYLLHISYFGTGIMICAMVYLYTSINQDGTIGRENLAIIVLMLTSGLACTRAKYYAIYLFSLFFLFIYYPGVLKRLSLKYIALFLSVITAVFIMTWEKFSYYFIFGNSDTFDPHTIDTYARPVLYFTGAQIMLDHFPLGTGLASFASYMSGVHYSDVYYEYGINNIYGLSEQFPSFICDAFYPSLAQFGIIGLLLFALFWAFIYSKLKYYLCIDSTTYKYFYVTGVLIILFLMIESIAATTFVQTTGMQCMIMLGILCGNAENIYQDQKSDCYVNQQ